MDDRRGRILFSHRGRMRKYITNTAKAIPHILELGRLGEFVSDEQTARFYGLHEYTGVRGFWRKVRIYKKAKHGSRR